MSENVEQWLDDLDPADVEWRDAGHLRAIRQADRELKAAQENLVRTVAAARADEETWAVIGAAFGTTRSAAEQRFGRKIREVQAEMRRSA